MGSVWLATDRVLDRDVAVKQVVSTEGMSDSSAEDLRARALHEGRMAARLNHRNAIAMHDIAVENGEPWLVMEYAPSRSVAQILHTMTTLPVALTAQIGAQVAAAMAAAHAQGIVHRDIKPGNILITNTGRAAGTVKISDFGISRAVDESPEAAGSVITGTPAYFAPEVARGAEPTESSDVYSLGATVYTMVEGEPPFGVDEDSMVLLHRVARGVINPPTKAGPLTPAILSMLEPSPAKRPTMAAARDQLARVAAGPGGNPALILSSPLPKSDTGIPIWGSSGRAGTRTGRSAPRTESGLPAAQPTPVRPTTRPSPAPPQAPQPTVPSPTPQIPTPTRATPTNTTPTNTGESGISPQIIGAAVVAVIVVVLLILLVV
ncbi:serine/threonine protein kinase [Williamsia sp. CHRR-6]|nr:serine/threonine protein kinase [Williamsia sp. CHRR-6]